MKDKQSIAICIINPSRNDKNYGDLSFAEGLQRGFIEQKFDCVVLCRDEWEHTNKYDIVIFLRGYVRYYPKKENVNILWVISSPLAVTIDELNEYDLIFCASKLFTEKLKSMTNKPVYYIPQATDIANFEYENNEEKIYDLLFIGNNNDRRGYKGLKNKVRNWICKMLHIYPERCLRKIVRNILISKKDYKLAIIGHYWEEHIDKKYIIAKSIPPEKLSEYYGKAKINLNDHREQMRLNGFINNRVFDIASLGLFQISDYVEGMDDIGIVTYKSKDELIEKVEYYLAHYEERENIARLNREKVSTYTFSNQAKIMIEKISIHKKDDGSEHVYSK